MQFANATSLNRKSGGAEWRDLRFLFQFSVLGTMPLHSNPLSLLNLRLGLMEKK